MSTERINKFQPDRTLYLRGFTGFGAAASLCEASPAGFKVYGVFRDQADFAVAVLYDADNIYEHYSVKHLPDFNLSGMVLNFSLAYQGLQPIDSAKYSWIDWAQMDVVRTTGEPAQIPLWDHATLVSGSYSAAQGTYAISAPGGCAAGDQLILYANNVSFGFTAHGGETAAQVAQAFANDINSHDWSTYANTSVAVIASADTSGNLTLTNARTGTVNVNGTSMTWQGGREISGYCSEFHDFLRRCGVLSKFGGQPDNSDDNRGSSQLHEHTLSCAIWWCRRERCADVYARQASERNAGGEQPGAAAFRRKFRQRNLGHFA